MPTITPEESFEQARIQAANSQLVVVRLDGKCLMLPVSKASMKPETVAAMEQMIPSTTKRNIAVIGDVAWAGNPSPSIQAANQAMPFFGLLTGVAAIGHSVWVFHGSSNLIAAGCRTADLLIVDSASVVALPSDWQAQAEKVMRIPQIVIHDRATYKLRPVNTLQSKPPQQN